MAMGGGTKIPPPESTIGKAEWGQIRAETRRRNKTRKLQSQNEVIWDHCGGKNPPIRGEEGPYRGKSRGICRDDLST